MILVSDPFTAEYDALVSSPPVARKEHMAAPYKAAEFDQSDLRGAICYAHIDYGNKLPNAVHQAMKLAASVVYPGYGLVEMDFDCEAKDFLLARAQIFAKLRRSVRGNLLFLDTDVISNKACEPWADDFDVGITSSGLYFPMMPFDTGVMFVKDTPNGQLFMDAMMELMNDFATLSDYWFFDKLAVAHAYLMLRDKIKIKIFPHELYNFSPPEGHVEDYPDKYFIHLKGGRKPMYADYLRYSMHRHGRTEVTALPAERLSMEPPVADMEALKLTRPNIATNSARGLPAHYKRKLVGKAAIVGYGPSLHEHWPQLRDFQGYIFTGSKAHDFLVERGITPHFHVELDYREHKADFVKLVSPETQYILATQVHPLYIDRHLARDPNAKIELFHSDNQLDLPLSRDYPKVAAQWDCGLQASYMAYRMGLGEQVWIGMDASSKDGATHAGPHGGMVAEATSVQVGDVVYSTTAMLLRQAMFAELMVCKYPFIRPVITGSGMLRPFLQARGRAKLP